MSGGSWHRVCDPDEIEPEDAFPFQHSGRSYAVYRLDSGYYATDGLCTHEQVELAFGIVVGDVIECPLHQGRFEIPTGRAIGAPACVDLATYPVKQEDDGIYIRLPDAL